MVVSLWILIGGGVGHSLDFLRFYCTCWFIGVIFFSQVNILTGIVKIIYQATNSPEGGSVVFIYRPEITGRYILDLLGICVVKTPNLFRIYKEVLRDRYKKGVKFVGICWNQLQLGFPWSSRVTNGLECYLLFRIPNLESGFAASLE